MNILTALEIWAISGPVAGFFACKYLPRIKQAEESVVAEVKAVAENPVFREQDEFLIEKDGQFVPLDPPEFVPAGQNPVAASRARSRAEGRTYHTRRIGD